MEEVNQPVNQCKALFVSYIYVYITHLCMLSRISEDTFVYLYGGAMIVKFLLIRNKFK